MNGSDKEHNPDDLTEMEATCKCRHTLIQHSEIPPFSCIWCRCQAFDAITREILKDGE